MPNKDYRYQDYQAKTFVEDSTSPNTGITIGQVGAVITAGETQYDAEHVLSFPCPILPPCA